MSTPDFVKKCSAVLLAAFIVICATLASAAPPNIVFLFADDQRRDTIAAYGNKHIKSPTLDRLVKKGFNFRQAYSMALHCCLADDTFPTLFGTIALLVVPLDDAAVGIQNDDSVETQFG